MEMVLSVQVFFALLANSATAILLVWAWQRARAAGRKPAEPALSVPLELRPRRRRLPDERESLTHKFTIGGHEGYLTVGKYDDGSPGEIFITMSREGSTIGGLMDGIATLTSIALQHGVPLEVLVDKMRHTRFEPSGFTRSADIPMAKSVLDYIFHWLELKFIHVSEASVAMGVVQPASRVPPAVAAADAGPKVVGFNVLQRTGEPPVRQGTFLY